MGGIGSASLALCHWVFWCGLGHWLGGALSLLALLALSLALLGFSLSAHPICASSLFALLALLLSVASFSLTARPLCASSLFALSLSVASFFFAARPVYASFFFAARSPDVWVWACRPEELAQLRCLSAAAGLAFPALLCPGGGLAGAPGGVCRSLVAQMESCQACVVLCMVDPLDDVMG